MGNNVREEVIIRIIAGENSWIEGEAVQQLEKTAALPGMKIAVGMPDLHAGKGHPIGAAFITEGVFYPSLVGNDIGCGMGLWQTDIPLNKLKIERWVKKLNTLSEQDENTIEEWSERYALPQSHYNASLGTIGGGNHFAELQQVESIEQPTKFEALGLDRSCAVLLVHSGSRGLGESILRQHVQDFGSQGLADESQAAVSYKACHDYALRWAIANRALIAKRLLSRLGYQGRPILDICHNQVMPITVANQKCWIHRKGATPSDHGCVMISGSRGSWSYLIEPIGDQSYNAYSLAHGAGRKWKRSDAQQRLSQRFSAQDLRRTKLGSWVVCQDDRLIYEEAPQAYKDIDQVITDLVEAGLIQIIAKFIPLLTYKGDRQ
ncbi:RNA ligase RtcB family protein [Candidatus Odyssella thessalonicensis]|uniref:RNA ligase RtcB family protein n=1 Tax=Candidatus Odyssella thessalonicensis TaxID=84647 RepID=UPI000225A9D0|nr:RNA ligase RtcB family protein [Candidatus Odyssella thessalonicensis]